MTSAERLPSVFETLRPCSRCGTQFYPPRRADHLILDYCSAACERAVGLRPMKRTAPSTAEPTFPSRRKASVLRRGPHIVPNVVRSRFGARLIAHRMALGLTQVELAARIGVHARAIQKWELDLAYPSVQHLATMATVFGVTMDELWRGGS